MTELEYYKDPGARLVSAHSIEELETNMMARYCRLRALIHSINRPYEDHRTSKEQVAYFEQHNPGYPGDFRETWNSIGLRQAHEISTDVACCFYGCSITWGVGVPDSAVWVNQLARGMGWSYNNFAISALSQEECVNLFMVTSRMVKMRTAIFMLPDSARITQAFKLKGSLNFRSIAGPVDHQYADFKQFHKDYISLPDEYFYDRTLRNLEIIARLAELQGIRVIVSTWSGVLPQVHNLHCVEGIFGGHDKGGRDKRHPGCEWHTQTAQHFQTAIKGMGLF
jgi:hypothetical protein